MLNVHDYLAIRIAHQNNESKRSIARRLHHAQATVAKAIAVAAAVRWRALVGAHRASGNVQTRAE